MYCAHKASLNLVQVKLSQLQSNQLKSTKVLKQTKLNQLIMIKHTGLSFGIFPSASSFALACRRLRIRRYCFAFTYNGSSSRTSLPVIGTREAAAALVLGTIYNTFKVN